MKKKYQTGGPAENLQKLGNITFDSNKARTGKYGQLIVKDIKTRKDYGVIRNTDGSYRFFEPKESKYLQDNIDESLSWEQEAVAKLIVGKDPVAAEQLRVGKEVLEKLSYYSTQRKNGKMSEDELAYRKKLSAKINPFTYNIGAKVSEYSSDTIPLSSMYRGSRRDHFDFYLGLPQSDTSFRESKYKPALGGKDEKYYMHKDYNDRHLVDAYLKGIPVWAGKSKNNVSMYNSPYFDLGEHTVGRGIDEKGQYISIYDKWDLDPLGYYFDDRPDLNQNLRKIFPSLDKLNNPFQVYDRVYLNSLQKETQDSILNRDKELGITPMQTKKYATGGTYQPVGLPVDPAQIREQKKIKREQESGSFWRGLSNVVGTVAPFVAGPIGGLFSKANQFQQLSGPDINMPQPTRDNLYNDPYASDTAFAATGGDLSLSSSAFQVQGNPNTTDGNYYPNLNAKLDHNEVVSSTPTGNPFIFSDDLKLQGKPISYMAKKLERSKGKAEKILSANPYDEQAKNTITFAEKGLTTLAAKQEELATAMGHRNPDGSTKQPGQYRTGGVMRYQSGGPGQGFIDMKDGHFYNPTTKEVVYNLEGQYIPVIEGKEDLIAQYSKQSTKTSTTNGPSNYQLIGDKSSGLYFDPQTQSVLIRDQDTGKYTKADPAFAQQTLAEWATYSNNGPATFNTTNNAQVSGSFMPRTTTPNRVDTVPYTTKDIARLFPRGQRPEQPPLNTLPGYLDAQWNLPPATEDAVVNNVPEIVQPAQRPVTSSTPRSAKTTSSKYNWDGKTIMNTPGPGSYAPNYEDRTYIEYTNPNPFDKTQVKFEQKNIPNVYATPADEIAAIRKTNTPLQTLPYSINGQSHRYVNLPGGGQKLVQTAPGGDPYTSANAPKPTLPGTTQHLNAVNSFVSKQDDYSYTTPFTVGDALQAAEVASKFGMLGSPEVETPNLDSTSITKNVYDVRPQIYQSQRSFNQVKHGIGSATNLNTRRALLSSAYANKLNTDSQIIDRYHNLNNEANTQYEQRLADQRRYNIQQQNYTNDINARNRGQHYTLLDNAWTSLGNFGEQLNNKVFANDTMALYEEMFPEVYKDNAKALDRNRSLKLGRRRYGK